MTDHAFVENFIRAKTIRKLLFIMLKSCRVLSQSLRGSFFICCHYLHDHIVLFPLDRVHLNQKIIAANFFGRLLALLEGFETFYVADMMC